MASDAVIYEWHTGAKSYHIRQTTFTKCERAASYGLPWIKQRFAVEAAALRLLREQTNIPAPRLLAFDEDVNGLCYLVTEIVPGSVPGDMAAAECRMPHVHRPAQRNVPCAACDGIVRANADQFVRQVVLPQLSSLRSKTTGLDGFVIPPRWVYENDERVSWPVLSSPEYDFVFCHNDLVIHNMLFSLETLEVLALLDMEECGYFPPEIQQW
ncbi:hypothetical protein CC80DRAFT_394835, partial [Byssothecium circinans]